MKNPFRRRRKEVEAPREWIKPEKKRGRGRPPKKKVEKKTVTLEVKRPRKIRLHGLRFVNRGLAVVLLLFNLFVSQGVLMSSSDVYPLFFVFILNAYICMHYLWKTRNVETAEWTPKK